MHKRAAFVHCRIMPGGARHVLLDIIATQSFERARVFTLISKEKQLFIDNKSISITCALPSRLCQLFFFFDTTRIPILSWLFDYRNLMPFYPLLVQILSWKMRRYKPDKIVISSFAIAKNIDFDRSISSILYLHSPMQYIHSHYDEYREKLRGLKGVFFRLISSYLKRWDHRTRSYDVVYANSEYTAMLAQQHYGLEPVVVYPRLDTQLFSWSPCLHVKNYFVYVGRLVHLVKEVDRIIQLFNTVGEKLVVVGSGPDEKYLKKIAGETILFVGRINDPLERYRLISQSRGLINITKESFGLVTAESLLLGVPVFGFGSGATKELIENHSGWLVPDKTMQTLDDHFKAFSRMGFDRPSIQAKAREIFSDDFLLPPS